MGLIQKSGLMKRGNLKKGGFINRKGPLTTLWDDFRAKKLIKDRNSNGEILCQDWKLGLPACELSVSSPDLHHIKGREEAPALYFSNSNLVWLLRSCHDAAHRLPKSGIMQANDKIKNTDRDPVATLPEDQERMGNGKIVWSSRSDSPRTLSKERIYD